MIRACKRCNADKPEEAFKSLRAFICKDCLRLKANERSRKWYQNNEEKGRASCKQWRSKNVEYDKERTKAWHKNNPEKSRKQHWDYVKARMDGDPIFKFLRQLRTRIHKYTTGRNKGGSFVKDLGCSGLELRAYLEDQFGEGMSWDNYGTAWVVDHIEPLCSFDLTNPEQFKKAAHFSNLRPLWSEDNYAKRIEDMKKSIRRKNDYRD